ncbi:MAG: hypothetical protein WA989_01970 [Henriciella sp.]|uniref:hypothetical protein n=1 Tax=Henriciella sp. TaxID=1968823 RepID=UPI003C78C98E
MSQPAIKPKTAKTLTRLVSLRRQQAEQAFAQARQEVAAAEAVLGQLEAALRAAPSPSQDFAAFSLSEQNGNSKRLLARIADQQRQIDALKQDMAEKRETLKRAFGSERRLGEITARPK